MEKMFILCLLSKVIVQGAGAYFARVGTALVSHFIRLGSKCVEMDATDTLRALHDFYRTGRVLFLREYAPYIKDNMILMKIGILQLERSLYYDQDIHY